MAWAYKDNEDKRAAFMSLTPQQREQLTWMTAR